MIGHLHVSREHVFFGKKQLKFRSFPIYAMHGNFKHLTPGWQTTQKTGQFNGAVHSNPFKPLG